VALKARQVVFDSGRVAKAAEEPTGESRSSLLAPEAAPPSDAAASAEDLPF
jgi:hypothetical protein